MILKIFGSIWALIGFIGVFKPGFIRDGLVRKINRKVKKIVLLFLILFCVSLLGSVLKVELMYQKIIAIAAMILSIKVILILYTKFSEKFFQWISGRTILFFRVFAGFLLVIGIMMCFGYM